MVRASSCAHSLPGPAFRPHLPFILEPADEMNHEILSPASEVETADDADDADKPELGGETGRMSPKHAP